MKPFLLFLFLAALAAAQQNDDPFAGVTPSAAKPVETAFGWKRFFSENFGFREELMFQFDSNQDGDLASRLAARTCPAILQKPVRGGVVRARCYKPRPWTP